MKYIEERLDDCEENVANVAQYSFEEFQKQAEENRNMALLVDNVNARCEHLEEHLAMLVDTLLDMDMHK